MSSLLFVSQAGCLLPILILLNLFLGWLFFKPLTWLAIEGALVLLFMLNSYILARSISSASRKNRKIIDVEGEVVEERDKLK
jgi:hypothetical protein